MDSKLLASIILVCVFAVTFLVLQQTSSKPVNPIDPDGAYLDYVVEEKQGITEYRVFGTVVDANSEEIRLETSQRRLDIKIPASASYYVISDRKPVDVSRLKGELVRAAISVSKSTSEIVSLEVVVTR